MIDYRGKHHKAKYFLLLNSPDNMEEISVVFFSGMKMLRKCITLLKYKTAIIYDRQFNVIGKLKDRRLLLYL